ncbi:8418_t:CDS:1 [Ambispora gerdemannii]|uniref:8418_t:CDS:1 n=1 Tax=Ambispora gerdemannii TaxID=144530 RepID=A0A9N9BR73_9GLOM|nr:8418_t:CDS:1 [Ambispora gerdemannii]
MAILNTILISIGLSMGLTLLSCICRNLFCRADSPQTNTTSTDLPTTQFYALPIQEQQQPNQPQMFPVYQQETQVYNQPIPQVYNQPIPQVYNQQPIPQIYNPQTTVK